MFSLLRDSCYGNIIRILTRGRFFKYEDETHPELWHRYINIDKSADMARGSDASSSSDVDIDTRVRNVPSRPWEENGQRFQGLTGEKVDPEKGTDIMMVDWLDDKDQDNPRNWHSAKKAFVTFEICLLTFGIYIGSSIYSAGEQDIMRRFHVSQVVATLGLSLFVAGYGTGPFLWSPMSEIPVIGRNPVYFLTLVVFVAFQVPVALATNLGMLLAFRFLTGFFGSPVLATGGASIGDMYSPSKRAYAMGIYGISAVCGPSLGPLIGGFAAQAEGWKWPIWELLWMSGFALLVLFFLLPETSSANILYRRTRRLRKATGNQSLRCQSELDARSITFGNIAMTILVRPFVLNFTEPMVFLLNLYLALIYGLLYVWFESFAIVFIQIYGFNIGQEGLSFLGLLVGAIVVIPPFYWWMHRYLEPKFDENGNVAPEVRLPAACAGAFAIPICLFWFGWTARPSIHWIVPIIGSGFFSIGAFLLFISIFNYLADAYPLYAASVLAGNNLFRASFGTGFPLFASAMYKNLGVGWASSTLGFISIVFIPIPFALYGFGKTLRTKYSMHARKDI